jgi:hypothetical protein
MRGLSKGVDRTVTPPDEHATHSSPQILVRPDHRMDRPLTPAPSLPKLASSKLTEAMVELEDEEDKREERPLVKSTSGLDLPEDARGRKKSSNSPRRKEEVDDQGSPENARLRPAISRKERNIALKVDVDGEPKRFGRTSHSLGSKSDGMDLPPDDHHDDEPEPAEHKIHLEKLPERLVLIRSGRRVCLLAISLLIPRTPLQFHNLIDRDKIE